MKKEFIVERNGRSFVLYAGLLDLAHERGLAGIETTLVQIPAEANKGCAIVSAVVTMHAKSNDNASLIVEKRFTGLGDADASNVSRMMVPHLIRMAETRAKARALRDAVNVGVTALEEVGGYDDPEEAQDVAREKDARVVAAAVGRQAGPATAAEHAAAEVDDSPATQTQRDTIAKLASGLGITLTGDPEKLTRRKASELITQLSEKRYAAAKAAKASGSARRG